MLYSQLNVILLICLIKKSFENPDAKRLYDDLLSNYNRLIRPVLNNSDIILIKLGLRLSQLIELNLKDQILTTNVWLEHEWEDHKFKWNPAEYGGVTELYVPSEHIWLPDIVLYNNADGDYVVTTMTKAVISYNGVVQWDPPTILKSSCEIDVQYFPFDQQTCFMKFGSWTYYGDFIDLKHINQNESDMVEVGIHLKDYYPSVEWDILSVPAERHIRYYPCCEEPFPDIFFNITLRRKTLFYTVNLIIPVVGISYLSILVFYLPADSGEKIALSISILLSQTMFFLLISEIMPSTSLAVPLLSKYLLFTMILIGLCVVLTIIILNIHHRKPSTHKMSRWTRCFFMRVMPRLLCMRIPNNLLQTFPANPPYNPPYQRTSESRNSLSSHSSSSVSIISTSKRTKKNSSSFTTPSAAKINDMIKGYNGFYSIFSELEGKMQEFPKKKYPLQLEKAIYNVMFIQNHMQRMDEFNAEDQDWAFIAMVMDRLFLWLFLIASLLGTWLILSDAPALYDKTEPIDIALSTVFTRQNLSIFKKN